MLTVQKIEIHPKTHTETFAEIALSPLERGFGHTLGNALRRIMLSSMPGAAITEVSIKGVDHEYAIKEGMREDVLQVLLNLKKVAIKIVDGSQEVVLQFSVKGGVITAGDIKTTHAIEIINKDLIIAHLDDGVSLDMQLYVTYGRGYQPASLIEQESTRADTIKLDASFSPVISVTYDVEDTRVENRTDLDSLIMKVETDGTITPEDTIKECANILQQQLAQFVDLEETVVEESAQNTNMDNEANSVLSKSVDELGLSNRAANCLKKSDISTIGELVKCTQQDLMSTPNFGKKSLDEIIDVLDKKDLSLGMQIDS